jgi:hypothetical protein
MNFGRLQNRHNLPLHCYRSKVQIYMYLYKPRPLVRAGLVQEKACSGKGEMFLWQGLVRVAIEKKDLFLTGDSFNLLQNVGCYIRMGHLRTMITCTCTPQYLVETKNYLGIQAWWRPTNVQGSTEKCVPVPIVQCWLKHTQRTEQAKWCRTENLLLLLTGPEEF